MIAFVQWLQGSPWSLAVRQINSAVSIETTASVSANHLHGILEGSGYDRRARSPMK